MNVNGMPTANFDKIYVNNNIHMFYVGCFPSVGLFDERGWRRKGEISVEFAWFSMFLMNVK